MTRRRIVAAVFVLGALGAVGAVWFLQPSSTPAIRGAQVASRLGCFACHGPGGTGGIANPRSRDPEIPAWDGGTAMMYIESEQEIREWILFGAPRRLRPEGVSRDDAGQEHIHGKGTSPAAADEHGLIAMPAYEGRIDEAELADLVAYFKAVAAYEERPLDEIVRQGRRVASRAGCFGCHGSGGQVAMTNPGSLKGVIPTWDSADFAELVRDEDELRTWILDGGIPRLREHPIARRFLERQVIAMPAYRNVLDDQDLDAIVAYIHWLRRAQPSGGSQ